MTTGADKPAAPPAPEPTAAPPSAPNAHGYTSASRDAVAAIVNQDDDEPTKRRLREGFALAFFSLFKMFRLYDANNEVVQRPAAVLKQIQDFMFRRDGSIMLFAMDESYYFNKERLRLKDDEIERIKYLFEELLKLDTGGIHFHHPLEDDQLRDFIAGVSRMVDDGQGITAARDAYFARWNPMITLIPPQGSSVAGGVERQIDQRKFAILAYSRLLVYTRQFMANISETDALATISKRIRRSMQDLTDVCTTGAQRVLGLHGVKYYDDYLPTHSVNVAVYAMALGTTIGLTKNDVCELGLAAIYHNLGMLNLPADLLSKAEELGPNEWEYVRRHPEYSATVFMRTGQINPTIIRRIVVAYEHHQHYDGGGYPPHALENAGMDLFSCIIAIADSFIALTSERPHRRAFLPDEALKIMLEGAGSKYHPQLLKIFINLLGIYPLGTLLQLSNGDAGIVYANHPDPAFAERPTVRMVFDRNGQPMAPDLVDLSLQDPSGDFRLNVLRTLDAKLYRIDVNKYLN